MLSNESYQKWYTTKTVAPLKGYDNKTPGYVRDNLQHSTLLKMPFKRMKVVFLNYFVSSSHFLTSLKSKFFWFLSKKTEKRSGKSFPKQIQFENHSIKNLPHVAILKKFRVLLSKELMYCPEKNPKLEPSEKSYYCSCILRQICYFLVKQ